MPNRMLRDWTDSLKFEAMPAETERLFVRLIMKADDYGRLHADARLVRAACYPLEDCTTAKVKDGLADLAKRGLIYTYAVEDRPYLAIVNYGQRLKQSRPKFPQPDGEDVEWKPTSGNFRELPARSRSESEREVEDEEKKNVPVDEPPGDKIALNLSTQLLEAVGRARGKKLVSTPKSSRKPIADLMKRGVTEKEILEVIAWLEHENPKRGKYSLVIESGKSLFEKWDKLQAAMSRTKSSECENDPFGKTDEEWAAIDAAIEETLKPDTPLPEWLQKIQDDKKAKAAK